MKWNPIRLMQGSTAIDCVVARPTSAQIRSLCIIPAKNTEFVYDPEFDQGFTQRALSGGAAVLCFPNYYSDLRSLAAQLARAGDENPFLASDRRINALIDGSIDQGLGSPGRIVLIGVSRFGFASLHAMAHSDAISAVAAISPVTWWPHLTEFAGMEDNPAIQASDLNSMVERLPPRPLLVQVGLSDDRIGTQRCRDFARRAAQDYQKRGAAERFCFQEFDVAGHVSNARFYAAVADWLEQQGFLAAAG